MSWNPVLIEELKFLSNYKPEASINFNPGINVICGASDTGKSFILNSIDFLFGSKELKKIPECSKYLKLSIKINISNQNSFILTRLLQGGDFELLNSDNQEKKVLKSKHSQNSLDNLSNWLLNKIGLSNLKIKVSKNRLGNLTLRNLASLVIVREKEMYQEKSPFLSIQYTEKTRSSRILKTLITGIDDSTLTAIEDIKKQKEMISAKLDLIQIWLDKYQEEFKDISKKDIEFQLDKLLKTIKDKRFEIENIQTQIEPLLTIRDEILGMNSDLTSRIREIESNLERFDLLKQHYEIDLERLDSINESGNLLNSYKKIDCPICGTPPEQQHNTIGCEGNIDLLCIATKAEITKIHILSNELNNTIENLQGELKTLNSVYQKNLLEVKKINKTILKLKTISLTQAQKSFNDLIEKKGETKILLQKFDQLDWILKERDKYISLKSQKNEKHSADSYPKYEYDRFSIKFKEILNSWDFPEADRVFFDEKAQDFIINGKPRGSFGKGLRAITHAAATIALMEYCHDENLPHPGFVALDSPLLAYYEPEGNDDDLRGTELKTLFYKYLISIKHKGQIIIIDNEHPPTEFQNEISVTCFTKNPSEGRYGFFPNINTQ